MLDKIIEDSFEKKAIEFKKKNYDQFPENETTLRKELDKKYQDYLNEFINNFKANLNGRVKTGN